MSAVAGPWRGKGTVTVTGAMTWGPVGACATTIAEGNVSIDPGGSGGSVPDPS